MSLQNATAAAIAFARYFAQAHCPQCGQEQLLPERSAFIGEGRVHHTWLCEACGDEFTTTVEIGRAAA